MASKEHQHQTSDLQIEVDNFRKKLHSLSLNYISQYDQKRNVKGEKSPEFKDEWKVVERMNACTTKLLSFREKTLEPQDDPKCTQEKPTGNASNTTQVDIVCTQMPPHLDKTQKYKANSSSRQNKSPSSDTQKQSDMDISKPNPGPEAQLQKPNQPEESHDASNKFATQTDNSHTLYEEPIAVQKQRETDNSKNNLDDEHGSAKRVCPVSHDPSVEELSVAKQTSEDRSKELDELHKQIEEKTNKITGLQRVKHQMRKTETELLQLNKVLQNKANVYEVECETLKTSLQNCQTDYSDKIKALNGEIADLLKRLSMSASDKMERNNHDVADLSDPYRATVIADKYKQLYETPWTTAFRARRKHIRTDDNRIIQDLLNILTDSFKYCTETAKEQLDALSNIFHCPNQTRKEMKTRTHRKMEDKQLWSLLKLRKEIAVGAVNEVIEGFFNYLKEKSINKKETSDYKESTTIRSDNAEETTKVDPQTGSKKKATGAGTKRVKSETGKHEKEVIDTDARKVASQTTEEKQKCENAIKAYTEKCVEVCWMMVLHNPPIHLGTAVKLGDPIDLDVFTQRSEGHCIGMLVWPVLHLGHGGGILSKGVVEGQRSITKHSVSHNTTRDVHSNQ